VTLQQKILSFLVPLGLLSAVLTISIFNSAMDATLTQQVVQIARSEAESVSRKLVAGVESRDESRMLRDLQVSQKVAGATHLMVLDGAGLVLAHTNVSETGRRYADPSFQKMMKAGDVHVIDEKGDHPLVLVSAPIWSAQEDRMNEEMLLTGQDTTEGQERMGTVVISVPLQGSLATRVRMIKQLVWIVGMIGAVAILVAIGLIRGILKPVGFLKRGTAQISRGEYGVQIPTFGKDELSELAADFNRMSRNLSETTISKDFMSSVFTHMTEPLIVIGADGLLQMCNGATLRLLGYGENELSGRGAAVLLSADPKAAGEAVNFRPANDVDAEFVTKAGVKIPVVYSCSLLKNNNGETTGSILIARDMTERQRLETAMRRSEKMSAVGQLAAGVAHEINNPLGVILGYAQALVRRLPPADALEAPLRSIEKEAVRCKNLVQDLLTFSRVGKVEREPMDINKSVTAALSLVKAQAKIGQIMVERELAEGLPLILGNPNQIQQVIINLATNAMDALGLAGTISIRTEALEDGPLSWVCLKVSDSGSGIPQDILTRIFEPFFTTKPVGKGTGLGLSLVHEIVKKHSGTIDVQSRPGRTEFCVKFPARRSGASSEVGG